MDRVKSGFDLNEERLREEVNKRGAKRVLLQLPDGLKSEGPRLASIIEDAGAIAIISGDPCYGGCDLALHEARALKADLLIHYGHTRMIEIKEADVPVLYFEAKATVDILPAIRKALNLLKPWTRIGLATTVQHVDRIEGAKRVLEDAGKIVYIGRAGHMSYPGQVLGCDYSSAKIITDKVDAFLFIGGGRFHALGLCLVTKKPIAVADPYENRAYLLSDEWKEIMKRRWDEIYRARRADSFGVIVGLKMGQCRMDAALKVKYEIQESGKKAALLCLREITPQELMQFTTIDAFVNTACPRLSLDETTSFSKPLLTVEEAYVAIGKISWQELMEKGVI
ncbi:MAG: diphthamide biosynthesis enzyme Dph2 [Nitrososphaerota archaeon]|nr:diphthamide biosynthesis enzyme Dph2 [Candidatus Bathyarchaeota archaeon]MDW8048091.1 diphthamide biosynthesis enzyme Dph2 [Nitrososphaerota archaeon]